eukprot:symbB.v1.2.015924.t1/scaffold1202.1/size131747/8
MKRLFGASETMEEAVMAKNGGKLAELVKDKLGDANAALKLLQDSAATLSAEAPVVLESDALVLVELHALSVATPRGRFDITLAERGVFVQGKPLCLGRTRDVLHVLLLPKQEPNRKPGTAAKMYWVVLVLECPISVGKQQHHCLVLNANGMKAPVNAPRLGSNASPRGQRCAKAVVAGTTPEHEVLAKLFAACIGIEKAVEPDRAVCLLESVQAFSAREEGFIYPLSIGLCFVPKPAVFVPAEDMLQAEAGTGRGPRGADLLLHRVAGAQVRFESIPGSDMSSLLSYIKKVSSHGDNSRGDASPYEEDEDSDFEDEVAETSRPAKRRAVTRSQTKKVGAQDLVEDLPAPSRGKQTDDVKEDGSDEHVSAEETEIEDLVE